MRRLISAFDRSRGRVELDANAGPAATPQPALAIDSADGRSVSGGVVRMVTVWLRTTEHGAARTDQSAEKGLFRALDGSVDAGSHLGAQAHNPKVEGSNPSPATRKTCSGYRRVHSRPVGGHPVVTRVAVLAATSANYAAPHGPCRAFRGRPATH